MAEGHSSIDTKYTIDVKRNHWDSQRILINFVKVEKDGEVLESMEKEEEEEESLRIFSSFEKLTKAVCNANIGIIRNLRLEGGGGAAGGGAKYRIDILKRC